MSSKDLRKCIKLANKRWVLTSALVSGVLYLYIHANTYLQVIKTLIAEDKEA